MINPQKINIGDIMLEHESHTYRLIDLKTNFTSVTEFIDQFFEKFDKEKVAKNALRNNPKYADMTIEDVLSEWNKRSERGNTVHNELEDFIKNKKIPSHPMAKVGAAWLRKKEKKHYTFFSELIIYSKAWKIAGTIDLLIHDTEKDVYHIIDWKTNKKINKKPYKKNQKGIRSSSKNLDDCNYIHYSLQLSFYKRILESFYDLNVESLTIIHFKENIDLKSIKDNIFKLDEHYSIYKVKYMVDDIQAMLKEEDLAS
tara:strand:+ start:488 stop:1255 length:768 start_codon:yes stop_codon:yes gene_type:complete